jgi:ATP-dependent helicase HrpB
MPTTLPVDAVIPAILNGIASGSNLVLVAPPGAGKTTRVPAALLGAVAGQILVLEPRRIAARMAARRIAEETGSRLGGLVGYQVRFEDVTSPATRLRFLTEGLLARRLLSDPELRGVSAVVLDEFHERHLDTDLALALLRRLQLTSRPDLKLIVMSATLDAGPLARYLGDCPILRFEGRLFDIEVSHTPYSAEPLQDQVADALNGVLTAGDKGDVLVFLPGSAEIHRAARACETLTAQAEALLLPLHGSLTPDEQDRAVSPSDRRKIILSTNIAESSITIDGVTTVIDGGLARIAGDSPHTGLPTLQVQRISKASAIQRAGRAGRTQPGRAIRLYTAEDYHRRPDHDLPEIRRRELSQVLLTLRALGCHHTIEWLDAPPSEAVAAASDLLDRLAYGYEPSELARFPAHPRIARLILESRKRGVARAACRIAAVLASGERYTDTDAIHLGDREPSFAVRQAEKQLLRAAGARSDSGSDDDLRISLLSAFGDRVARLRSASDAQLANGKRATAPRDWTSEFFVAIDVEDRKDQASPMIRLASAIQPDWLLELFPDRIRETDELIWNRIAERVDAVSRMLYDDLVITESLSGSPEPAAAAKMLAERATETGLERFTEIEAVELLLARSEFCALHSEIRALTQDDVRAALEQLCYGLRSFAELQQVARHGLIPAIISRLGPGAERTLNEVAPERIPLKHRQVKVHYRPGQQPYIASRLQDFFGMRNTPKIARGSVPLLVHLLAPSQRPVQVTADLSGFWQRLYPQLRKELSRRYPKHAWPENPL